MIGGVILVLSALTAGATMFLSVQHRQAEIALRRSMGGSRASIWRLFTYEGAAIGLSGGILGTGLGILLAALLGRLNDWPLAIGTSIVAGGVLTGLLAGVIASVVPAISAPGKIPPASCAPPDPMRFPPCPPLHRALGAAPPSRRPLG